MRRDGLQEYLRGSLWVLPSVMAIVALALGALLSLIRVPADAPFAFQGTADDARAVLNGITATMVTVIALLLGLTVVALQLSSTQFSPRLLRNFLRDRPNQLVLGVFVGTFAYSAAGLFTVGIAGGERVEDYPRLGVTGAILLLFVSLALLVYVADHLAHSIQVDAIMRNVERNTLQVIRDAPPPQDEARPVPPGAISVPAARSGYLQWINVEARGGLGDRGLARRRAGRPARPVRRQCRVGRRVGRAAARGVPGAAGGHRIEGPGWLRRRGQRDPR